MVDDVTDIEAAPETLRTKRDELLKSIKPAEAPKLTTPEQYESLIKKETEATVGAAKKKSELEMARAERESRTARELSGKYESQYKDIPEFKPTPESKADLMGLFGLIGAVGAFGGGKSYGSALGAMNAMGGMLKGYREGRKDLFEREKAEFDKNLTAIKEHNNQITAAFNRAKELAKTNLPAAERKLYQELKAMEADALATNLYKKGLMDTDRVRIEAFNRSNTQMDQSLRTIASIDRTLKEKTSEKRTFVNVDGEQKYLTDAEIVQAQNEGKTVGQTARPSAATARPMAPSAAERKSYISLGNSVTTAEKLLKKLDDPAFAEKVKKYRWNNLFAEEGGKVASQLLAERIPQDVREFVQLGNALRNAYYLDISGKAVTGGEAMRNYNVVPQPGDTPDVLRSKFKILIDKFNDDRSDYREMYPQLPDLSGGSRPQVRPSASEKTATAADVQETARVRFNGNIEAAKKALRDRGFKIEGE